MPPAPGARGTPGAPSCATLPGPRAASRVLVTGAVQGVGFRPFVYGLAGRLGLAGTVVNTPSGVRIEAEGEPAALDSFVAALRTDAPALARIETIACETIPPTGRDGFAIGASPPPGADSSPVVPDAGICDDCRRELLDPSDRRFRHPFVNCTACGPRFTIVDDLPYDRPFTTMARFPMCARCAAEYADPGDRRFHAQPVACMSCGPRVRLVAGDGSTTARDDDAIVRARALLADGRVVAVKGIGGVHLACDAGNEAAVAELRRRKHRSAKPFALLVRDVTGARRVAKVSEAEAAVLTSAARPVVLLGRRADGGRCNALGTCAGGACPAPTGDGVTPSEGGPGIAPSVAPGRDTLGLMLPSAPIHELLFAAAPGETDPPRFAALVLTSGNVSDEPLAIGDDEALARLAGIADAFLLHDREIRTRADDSVVRVVAGADLPIRRSRGYAPLPVALPFDVPPLAATGSELKNTFCLARGRRAYVGPHVGDLGNWETLAAFDGAIRRCERLLRVRPVALAHDLHPDFLATRWAQDRAARDGLRLVAVQHHHAHAAACMAEHGLDADARVLAVAFDGAGLGTDGAVWGGEFLVASLTEFERAAHLAYVPLPGGDAATRHPWRMALSWLRAAGVEWTADLEPVREASPAGLAAVDAQIRRAINAPPTSSAGRLFDAVAAIAGVRQHSECEGQAAIELEVAAAACEDGKVEPYECATIRPGGVAGTCAGAAGCAPTVRATLVERDVPMIEPDREALARTGDGPVTDGSGPATPAARPLDVRPVIAAVAQDVRRGVPVPRIAARFHETVARLVAATSAAICGERGISDVVLTGGVFQNVLLLRRSTELLAAAGLRVRSHHVVPPNDGGLSLGQAAVAGARLRREGV